MPPVLSALLLAIVLVSTSRCPVFNDASADPSIVARNSAARHRHPPLERTSPAPNEARLFESVLFVTVSMPLTTAIPPPPIAPLLPLTVLLVTVTVPLEMPMPLPATCPKALPVMVVLPLIVLPVMCSVALTEMPPPTIADPPSGVSIRAVLPLIAPPVTVSVPLT